MIVKIEPLAIYLAVKRRKPNPHVGFLATLESAADPLQSRRVSELTTGPDVQIAHLDMNIAVVL